LPLDQGNTGERAAQAAVDHGMVLEKVKMPEVKRGSVLLSPQRVLERAFD
jgi:hypothetical protein